MPIKRDTLQETRSWELGFNFAWPVFERYAIKDGVLREGGQMVELIAPVAELRLLAALASVHVGTVTPENFASEFGLLGYCHICKPENRHGGDPLNWFKAQAKDVFEMLNLLADIGQKNIPAICQALKASPRFLGNVARLDNPIRAAERYIEIILNPHLEGIHRQLRLGADGLRSVFKPRALVDVVHWQLADLAEGRTAVRRCHGCNALFVTTDPRREYCPGKNCSMRLRVKRFRERQKKRRKS